MPDQALPEDPRDRQNRLLERLGTALIGLKTSVDLLRKESAEAHGGMLAQGNAHLTQLSLAHQAVSEVSGRLASLAAGLERVIAEVRRESEELRDDLTPVRGVPLVDVDADKAEVKIGPVRIRERLLGAVGRALPWIITGIIIGLAALVVALWLSGARLIVTEKPTVVPAVAPSPSAPALDVPRLRIDR